MLDLSRAHKLWPKVGQADEEDLACRCRIAYSRMKNTGKRAVPVSFEAPGMGANLSWCGNQNIVWSFSLGIFTITLTSAYSPNVQPDHYSFIQFFYAFPIITKPQCFLRKAVPVNWSYLSWDIQTFSEGWLCGKLLLFFYYSWYFCGSGTQNFSLKSSLKSWVKRFKMCLYEQGQI